MQKIFVGTDIWDFRREVDKYLVEGWKVVPTTLQIAASVSVSTSERFSNQSSEIERYVVVLEK